MHKRLISLLLVLTMSALPMYVSAQEPEDAWDKLFDQAELSPAAPGSDDLDVYLDGIMEDIFLGLIPEETLDSGDEEAITEAIGELTTYERTLACYDHIVETVTYASHMAYIDTPIGSTTCREIYQEHGAVEGFGAVALTAGRGMCNAYASAFILMARKIGLDAKLVTGYTRSGGGGYEYHEWAEIDIDGEIHVFDPQLDQSLAAQGLGGHIVFGKTYAQLDGRYDRNG